MQREFLLWLMLLPVSLMQRHKIWQWAVAHQRFSCRLAFLDECSFTLEMRYKLQQWYTHSNWVEQLGLLRFKPYLTIMDPSYPQQLKNIAQPPLVLFYNGDLDLIETKTVAIVGSRHIKDATRAILKAWIPELVRQGFTVISGNAAGVDSVTHRLVLGQRGHTIAVVGTGLECCYPKEHRALQNRISEVGLVLSEYLPWVGPKKWHFPERNRIIVGLTQDIFICQAAKKSGTMVTAEIALDENRNIWVIPGDVLDAAYAGSFELVQEGAQILTSVTDFTEVNQRQ